MARRKPKKPTKSFNKDRVGDDAKAAKRPQCGFRKDKDGSINVEPKTKAETDKLVAQAVML